jgi:hypothetical protein
MPDLISVRYSFVGYHNWPDAPDHRRYLRDRHRHKFEVEARIEITHDDREIEFHDFLDYCKANTPGGDMNNRSCEMIAKDLIRNIQERYHGRKVSVSVFEDGEVGAICTQ